VGVIEGAVLLNSLADYITMEKDHRIFLTVIASETDHLPIGSLREQWHADYLPSKEAEITHYEQLISNDIRKVCVQLIANNVEKFHRCPICEFDRLVDPPRSEVTGAGSLEVCSRCGFQFGVTDDDQGISYEQWRDRWKRGETTSCNES